MKPIDLHIHTNHSDGSFSPKEVVNMAVSRGMKAIAITDHDSISGIQEALDYSRGKNIKIVPGVEITCYEKKWDIPNLHVLGLFIDYQNKELRALLRKNAPPKARRILMKIVALLKLQKIKRILPASSKIIFKRNTSVKKAVEAVKKSGGIAILAHPGLIRRKHLAEVVDYFKKCKGDGIEADYPYDKIYLFGSEKSEKINTNIRAVAGEKGLIISGGSDFHGRGRNVKIGESGISEEEFRFIRKSISKNRNVYN